MREQVGRQHAAAFLKILFLTEGVSSMGLILTRRQIVCWSASVAIAASGMLFLGHSTAQAGRASSWHDYTQEKRNSLILARGLEDLEEDVGIECKPWVQRVVAEASKGVVKVPSTKDDGLGSSWYDSKDVARADWAFPLLKTGIALSGGYIIQMQWKTARYQKMTGGYWIPHTAILYRVSPKVVPKKMTWLDSNWVGKNTVGLHDVTIKDFEKNAIAYTFYLIL